MTFTCLRRTSTLVFPLMITSAVPSNSVSINTTLLSLYYSRHLSKPIFKQIGFLLQAGRGKSICHSESGNSGEACKKGWLPKGRKKLVRTLEGKKSHSCRLRVSHQIGRHWDRWGRESEEEGEQKGNVRNRQERVSLQERRRNYHFFPHNWLISQDRDSNSFEPSLSSSQSSHLRTQNASFLPCGRKLGLALFSATRQKVCETGIDIGIKLS